MSDLTNNLIPSGTLVGTLAVGAGITDYNALDNKPSINNVTLSGNKTGSDLGLVSPTDLATVATSGSYTDLSNRPQFGVWRNAGTILDETGIKVQVNVNDVLRFGILRVIGSSSTPVSSYYTCTLPSDVVPAFEVTGWARYNGYITIQANRNVSLNGIDTSKNWQSGSLFFAFV